MTGSMYTMCGHATFFASMRDRALPGADAGAQLAAPDAESHIVVAHAVAALLSRCGGALLVGSNAYNLVEGLELSGDLDFVVLDPRVVLAAGHLTRGGVARDVHVATFHIGGLAVDIATMDGSDLEEDATNRSCATSVVALCNRGFRVLRHSSVRRIVPAGEEARDWVQRMVDAKGPRVLRFWQKKFGQGFVWGKAAEHPPRDAETA